MKLHQLILIILITGLLSCQNKKGEIRIRGKIEGEIPKKIEYTLPINGVCNYAFKESVQADSLGNFTIKLNIEKPSFVQITIPGKTSGTLLVEKAMNYNVSFDLKSEEKQFKVYGNNQKGQNLYNSLLKNGYINAVAREFSKDSAASVIVDKITKLKEDELLKFKELLSNSDISEDFYSLVKIDRESYYAAIQATVALFKKYEQERKNNGVFTSEIKQMWLDAFGKSFSTNKSLLVSKWYYSLANNFVNYNEYTADSFNLNELKEIYEKGLIHTHNIKESKKYLNSDILEYYYATYLFNACLQKRYEKELIVLFKDFKTDFPNSQYTKFIEPMVTNIMEYHNKKDKPFSNKIKFIESYKMKNSLSEAVSSLKGKRIYIDVWATWCGPCKEEFKHKEELRKLLAENNTEQLYISIDKDDKDAQWKNMIKFYNLEGYHIRANEALDENLREIFGQNGSISIPWYILIDEKGSIIKKHASRPSQIKKLEDELQME